MVSFRHLTLRAWARAGQASSGLCAALLLLFSPAAQAQGVSLFDGLDGALEHRAFTSALNFGESRAVTLRAGESVAAALERSGVAAADVARALPELARAVDLRSLAAGQRMTLYFAPVAGEVRFAGLTLRVDEDRSISLSRTAAGDYRARQMLTALRRETARTAGTVSGDNLFAAVAAAGAPQRIIEALSQALTHEFDLQRDVRAGDSFEIVFERFLDGNGAVVRSGDVLFVRLATAARTREFYRFQIPGTQRVEWFDREGRSARRALMRTPISGARLSSGFGFRIHPVLGYSKMHEGVDFAAPTGTPIFAAGDGEVVRVAYMRGYGNTVDIKHDETWTTRYAHMSRFAGGLRPGDRVTQGQTIGFVGSTGRSTGPHLHYEIHRDGAPVDPMQVESPASVTLTPAQLDAFQAFRARVDRMRDQRDGGVLVAGAGRTTAVN